MTSADVVAPSSTGIFNQSLVTVISPLTGNWLKCYQFKNGSKSDLSNCLPISVIPTAAKIFEKIFFDQLYITI